MIKKAKTWCETDDSQKKSPTTIILWNYLFNTNTNNNNNNNNFSLPGITVWFGMNRSSTRHQDTKLTYFPHSLLLTHHRDQTHSLTPQPMPALTYTPPHGGG